MAKLSVLLDACVVFPMYLRDTLLSIAEAGLYIPYWSQKILDEATIKLVTKGIKTVEQARDFEAIIKQAFPEAMVEVPVWLVDTMTNDPKDRHVLAAAVTAKVDVIVTNNLKDFKAQDLPIGLKAQSPDDFLSDLFDDYPDEMVQIVRRQSNKYKKRKLTFAELLDFLGEKAKVKKFASKVLFYEYSRDVVQIAKKVLASKFARKAAEGGQCFEGDRYRLWQQGGILIITAKDSPGEILRVQDGQIQGNLTSKDIKIFQMFDQSLEQNLATPNGQQSELDGSPLETE